MVKCKISDLSHFKEAVAFARKLGGDSKKSFWRSLATLNRLKRSFKDCTLHIHPDFVKHSFYWTIVRDSDNKIVYNGGMILHGFQETVSVELCPETYPHWSIHT